METEYRNKAMARKVRTGLMAGQTTTSTIYGTDWCGFTTKQKEAFDKAGIKYNYVNCEKNPGSCKDVTSYPVVEHHGKRWVGFRSDI